MKSLARIVLGLLVAVFLSFGLIRTNAQAQGPGYTVIYSQPPSPAGGVMKSAWYPPNGLDGDEYLYDSFVLTSNQAISQIQWRGGYTNFQSGAGESPVYDFTISIYPSIAGGSQPDVTAQPLAQYNVGGNAGETPAGTIGGIPLYDYSYTLTAPFQATAGVKYWIQIEASQGLTPVYFWPPDWGLTLGTGGDGTHFRAIIGGTGGGGTLYQTVINDSAFTLLASTVPSYTIDATASPANAGTISGTGSYPAGSTVTLTATPTPGYGFVNWTENGVAVSNSATWTFTASANRTLVANFTTAYTITTNSYPIFGGTTTGGGNYNTGSTVTVIATPTNGYVFVNWTDGGTPVSTAAHYTFKAKADRTLTANFAPGPLTAVYDFDTSTPPLYVGQSLPFDQTSNGVTAHFTSPTIGAGGFSVQTDSSTQFHLSRFVGNYLYPNSVYNPALDIQFNQSVTSVTFTFATADFNQNEIPTLIKLTAYQNSTSNPAIGSATARGKYAGDTMPMGKLTFSSATPFNVVEIKIPPAPLAASDFLVDNIIVTATRVPATTIDDSDVAIQYDSWHGRSDANASGGTYHVSNTANDKVTFRFTGSAVKWVTRTGPDGGMAQVNIDGVSAGTIDLYSATTTWKVKQSFGSLTYGPHTLVVKVLASKNPNATDTNVVVDGFAVAGVATPDTSPDVQYGGWSGAVASPASGGSYHASQKNGSVAKLTFTGSTIKWLTARGPGYGKAEVIIDGTSQGTFDLYAAVPQWQVAISFNLNPGQHTIEIHPLGAKNPASSGTRVVVDGFRGVITPLPSSPLAWLAPLLPANLRTAWPA